MKKIVLILFLAIASVNLTAQGKYAGTKKSLIGKTFTDARDLVALKGWEFREGTIVNSLNDPERIMSDVFKKGNTYVVFFSIAEDTASEQSTIVDVVEITGVLKGWTVRASFCRQKQEENNYIIAVGKENNGQYIKLIKKAWKFDPDRRRINIIPVKGIDCENAGT